MRTVGGWKLHSGLMTAVLATACAGSGVVPSASPGAGSKAGASPAPVVALPLGVQARATSVRQVATGDVYQQALARAYSSLRGVTEVDGRVELGVEPVDVAQLWVGEDVHRAPFTGRGVSTRGWTDTAPAPRAAGQRPRPRSRKGPGAGADV